MQGFGPALKTAVIVPAELKAMALLFGAVRLDDTVLRPDSWLACPAPTFGALVTGSQGLVDRRTSGGCPSLWRAEQRASAVCLT